MVNSWKSTALRIGFKKCREKIQKERVEVDKKLRILKSEKFACLLDAETATKRVFKNLWCHEFKQINVQFIESKSESYFSYKVQVKVELRESKIELEKKQKVDLYWRQMFWIGWN